MSAPAASRQLSAGRDIPAKRVAVDDPSQLPQDYSTTPGGTLFSTTPGGTRIIYDRHFLLNMRNSPLSQTPPKNLPSIPGVTCPEVTGDKPNGESKAPKSKTDTADDQFQMDI
ncbi:eukaryotic translation initiation factor 4E-binding protein 2-like [Lytechinus variegatus]|uniref:eukaryotic translation initiation factor 4E-binding protein 2-like n=1 Tax=Lytechinus variegatus TaxID=7654 RepID=UPI001BB247AF|nr:eukaryotic translation initiation factor 4E-binding protein 2-like [Lytechinus variegatus]